MDTGKSVEAVMEKARQAMYNEEPDRPAVKEIELAIKDVIEVNGLPVIVINIAAQSITVRPEKEPVYRVEGVPCKLHKRHDNGDLVFRPLDKKVKIERVHGTTGQRQRA